MLWVLKRKRNVSTCVLGAQKNCPIEVVLLSIQNTCKKQMAKKIIAILCSKSLLIWTYEMSIFIQSKFFISSLVITEYSISDIKLLGTDLFPLKFPLYNRIFT